MHNTSEFLPAILNRIFVNQVHNNKIILLSVIIIFTFFLTPVSFAQFGSVSSIDSRSIGMGKSGVAGSQGVFSIGINPANLSRKEAGETDFITILPVPSLSLRGGSNFLSFEELNYYFASVNGEGRELTDEDVDHLNELFQNGGLAFTNLSGSLLSIAYKPNDFSGTFAFSISDFAGGKINFPVQLIDFFLNGNEPFRTYDLSDAEIKLWWIRNYSVSYSTELTEMTKDIFDFFSAGFTLKFVQGFFYAGTEKVGTYIYTGEGNQISGSASLSALTSVSPDFGIEYDFEDTETELSASPFPSPVGSGFGFDFGLAFTIEKFWNIGIAITDAGRINWNDHNAEFISEGEFYLDDITNDEQIDSLEEKLTGESVPHGSFSTSLPTALRFGISRIIEAEDNFIPGSLLIEAGFNQGFNDMPGNSVKSRFSIGAEWKPGKWMPILRTGFDIGGIDKFNWAFGLGYDTGILKFNFATSSFQTFFAPDASSHRSYSISSQWVIF